VISEVLYFPGESRKELVDGTPPSLRTTWDFRDTRIFTILSLVSSLQVVGLPESRTRDTLSPRVPR